MNAPQETCANDPMAPGRPRLVIVPGLHGSGAEHWQSWLQSRFEDAVRVEQQDWGEPDLDRWSDRVTQVVDAAGPGPHVLVAHSFGCLATLHAAARRPAWRRSQLLLVAPAEPAKFGVGHRLPQARLGLDSCVVGSDDDPWMSATQARAWALRWGSEWINLGNAGHINIDSGYGPFDLAHDWTHAALHRLAPAATAKARTRACAG